MLIWLLCLFLVVSSPCTATWSSTGAIWSNCNQQDISALLQFKDDFQLNCSRRYDDDPFPYPKTSSWNVNNLTARWDGVDCHRTTGHVIGLDLGLSCLHGSMNSTSPIFHLLHLETLNLAYNNFHMSKIPSSLGKLSRLTCLNLSSAFFVGGIPSQISQLSVLSSLDLSYNGYMNFDTQRLLLKFPDLKIPDKYRPVVSSKEVDPMKSNIPDTISNMSSLRFLKLAGCDLHGTFPHEIFYLPNLRFLDVSFNYNLKGALPDFLSSNSSSLESIALGYTNFFGKIPSSIGNLVSLTTLDLRYSGFYGYIPPSLGNLTRLVYLHLSGNDFGSGSLAWVGQLTKIKVLSLSKIQLRGDIPRSFRNLTQLTELYLAYNQLSGEIPTELMNLTELTALNLGDNKLEGPIPRSISNLKNLRKLGLQSNNLRGEVDLGIFLQFKDLSVLVLSGSNLTVHFGNNSNMSTGPPPNLSVLGLSSCRLTKLPEFLQNQHQLNYIDLSNNGIKDRIPEWMWSVSVETLIYFNVSHNNIMGFINPSWRYLQILDVSFNKIDGALPIPPPTIQSYFASNNEFSGEIPNLICTLPSLQTLDLSNNHFTGELQRNCFGKFSRELAFLKLRSNLLHGRIPDLCANGRRSLKMVDLNGNFLEGKVPRSLANCTDLEFLDLGNNLIKDVFPSWLGSLPHLSIIIFKANLLHGSLDVSSTSQSQFPKLHIIDLSQNHLSGMLPASYFQQWNAMKKPNRTKSNYMGETLWLYHDTDHYYSIALNDRGMQREYSNILESLVAIDLSNNSFQGKIPNTLWNLRGLRFLNLSRNNLSGMSNSQTIHLF